MPVVWYFRLSLIVPLLEASVSNRGHNLGITQRILNFARLDGCLKSCCGAYHVLSYIVISGAFVLLSFKQ